MTGGIGFTKLGQRNQKENRSWLKKSFDKRETDIPLRLKRKKYLYKKSSKSSLQKTRSNTLEEQSKLMKRSVTALIFITLIVALIAGLFLT